MSHRLSACHPNFLRAKTMSNDPIIQETRQLRESYAEEHGHDIDAIFQDILRRQKESSKKFVRLPSRAPTQKLKSPNTVLQPKPVSLSLNRLG
jgi:hypothetical protein